MKRILSILCLLFVSCERPYLIGNLGNVQSTGGSSLQFETSSVGNSSDKRLEVVNIGQTKVSVDSILGLGTTFNYKGGVFPGVGGTCSQVIDQSQTCSMVFSFTPPTGGSHSATTILNYTSAGVQNSASMDFLGTGVSQGALDTSFGSNGYSIQDFDANTDTEKIKSLVVQSDGKILIFGDTNGGLIGDNNILISRLNTDGDRDLTFGVNGFISTDTGGNANDTVETGILMSDGKMLIVGSSGNSALVSKFLSTGLLDTTFGALGNGIQKLAKITTLALTSVDKIYDVAVQSDGKIIIVGETTPNLLTSQMFIVRLNTSGILDVSVPVFGVAGVVLVDYGALQNDRAQAVTIQGDGKILAAGYTDAALERNSSVVRTLPTGVLDITFGTLGKLSPAICPGVRNDEVRDIVVDADNGKIIIVGICHNGANNDVFVARLLPTGGLDTTFNGGGAIPGVRTIDIAGREDQAFKVILDSNKKIIVSGYTNTAGSADEPFLLRVDTNGNLDNLFGVGGIVTLGVGASEDQSVCMNTQGSKILIGGHTTQASIDFLVTRHFP